MDIKLHIGCGNKIKDGWYNLDNFQVESFGGDRLDKRIMEYNMCQKLPFNDNQVAAIYTEHAIEHIEEWEASKFLRECYRVLKPGSSIRIVTPDLSQVALKYVQRDNTVHRQLGLNKPNSCQYFNEDMRGWGHKYLYDFEDLSLKLKNAGFSTVRASEHGSSSIEVFKNVETRVKGLDLVVEATK
jgi:predicted SAM-dependent methyltransferase